MLSSNPWQMASPNYPRLFRPIICAFHNLAKHWKSLEIHLLLASKHTWLMWSFLDLWRWPRLWPVILWPDFPAKQCSSAYLNLNLSPAPKCRDQPVQTKQIWGALYSGMRCRVRSQDHSQPCRTEWGLEKYANLIIVFEIICHGASTEARNETLAANKCQLELILTFVSWIKSAIMLFDPSW